MKNILYIITVFISSNIIASDFLSEFDGKTVSCEIIDYSKDAVMPMLRDQFKANDIYITFDSKNPNGRDNVLRDIDEESLYVIEFKLVDKSLGTFTQFFSMDMNYAEISKEGRKNILTYEDEMKSYRLEFSENLLRDKYKFIKNGETQFVCKSLFDWR